MPLDNTIALVSVDDMLQKLGATDADHLDVEMLINAASARIETFCNRKFRRRTETITLDGTGHPLLDLGGPVVTVKSVNLDGTVLVAGADNDYLAHPARGQIYRSSGWGTELQSIVVEATVGDEPHKIPHEVALACVLLVKHWWANGGSSGSTSSFGLRRERIGEYEYERSPANAQFIPPGRVLEETGMPEEIRAILLPFRRGVWFG